MKERSFIIKSETIRTTAANAVKHITSDPVMVVIIKPFEDSRSLAQNRLFHKWVSEIASEAGNTIDTQKYELKRDFGLIDVMPDGVRIPRSTKKYKIGEFIDLLTAIEVMCVEMGWMLTQPDYYKTAFGEN